MPKRTLARPLGLSVSLLGTMSSRERALTAVLALGAHVPYEELHAGGYAQFLSSTRKPLANFGLTNADLEKAWDLIVCAVKHPTIWRGLLEFAEQHGLRQASLHRKAYSR